MPEILEVTKSWVTVCRKSWIFLLMEEYIFLTYFLIDAYGQEPVRKSSPKKCKALPKKDIDLSYAGKKRELFITTAVERLPQRLF